MKAKVLLFGIFSASVLFIAVLAFFFFLQPNKGTDSQEVAVENFKKYAHPKKEFDFPSAYKKGISSSKHSVSKEYLEIQESYSQLLADYLNERLDFEELDRELEEADIPKFDKKEKVKDRASYYRSRSYLDSSYLYLRNNLFIERLTEDELRTLNDIRDKRLIEKNQVNAFVIGTYRKVIAYYSDESLQDYVVDYEQKSGKTPTIKQGSLVFFTQYYSILSKKEQSSFSVAKENKLLDIIDKYQSEFSKKLQIDLIIHNEGR